MSFSSSNELEFTAETQRRRDTEKRSDEQRELHVQPTTDDSLAGGGVDFDAGDFAAVVGG
jgi:hypothetical protein